jgi:beta-phosphoglucomutase
MSNQSKAYKLFAFDIDGVLLESVEAHYLSFKDALYDVIGFTLSREENEPMSAMSTKQKLKYLEDANRIQPLSEVQHKEITRLKFEYMFRYTSLFELNPEVRSMFEYVKSKDIKICLVSNARKEYVKLVINIVNSSDLIDYHFGNDQGLKPKPYPDMYQAAMRACDAEPESTLIFEDSEVGLQAAYSSGANVFKVENHLQVTRELLIEILEHDVFSALHTPNQTTINSIS